MDYIAKIFQRNQLNQLCSFLSDGTESNLEKQNLPYTKLLELSSESIHQRLKNIYQDTRELDIAANELFKAMNTHDQVYLEIGMKLGAQLILQLLS